MGPVNLIDLSAPIRPDPPDYPEPLAERVRESGQPGDFWAAHQANLAYSQIERLVNLGAQPPDGFQVASFPLRIEGADAAPAREVAIVPEGDR